MNLPEENAKIPVGALSYINMTLQPGTYRWVVLTAMPGSYRLGVSQP